MVSPQGCAKVLGGHQEGAPGRCQASRGGRGQRCELRGPSRREQVVAFHALGSPPHLRTPCCLLSAPTCLQEVRGSGLSGSKVG